MPEDEGIEDSTEADKRDRLAAAQVPAIYVDAYWLTVWTDLLRITFGEALAGQPHYRTAIVMQWEEAETFARQVLEIIEARKSRDAKEEAEEKPKAKSS